MSESTSVVSLPTNTSSSSSESGADSDDDAHIGGAHEGATAVRYHARLDRARTSNRARATSASGDAAPNKLVLTGAARVDNTLIGALPDNKLADQRPPFARVAPM